VIVVDANILVYGLVEGSQTLRAGQVRDKDPDWRVPPLWKYEVGNALTQMARQKLINQETACQLMEQAEEIFGPGEMMVGSDQVLNSTLKKNLTFYDAQYLTLAQMLDVPLVTEDKALIKAGGKWALNIHDFLKRD
jgi:predicted nucleic acid-binding protein